MRNEAENQLFVSLSRQLASDSKHEPWSILNDAGVVGLRVPPYLGGLGFELGGMEPVFAAFGEAGITAPCLETSVIAAGLLEKSQHAKARDLLRKIANGTRLAVAGPEPELVSELHVEGTGPEVVLRGTARIVADGMQTSDLLLVLNEAVFIVDAPWSNRRQPVPTFDGRMAADIDLSNVSAIRLTDIDPGTVRRVTDEATVMVCIEAAAIMRRLVVETVEFAKTRQQFGQAIADFQVIQHRLVDMNILARKATAISNEALRSLRDSESTRATRVSAAKVTIGRCGRFIGQNAVQLHGAMGLTAELGISSLFKRLIVIESQLGSADNHLKRFSHLQREDL